MSNRARCRDFNVDAQLEFYRLQQSIAPNLHIVSMARNFHQTLLMCAGKSDLFRARAGALTSIRQVGKLSILEEGVKAEIYPIDGLEIVDPSRI